MGDVEGEDEEDAEVAAEELDYSEGSHGGGHLGRHLDGI